MQREKREWAEAGKCFPLRGQSRLREVGGHPRDENRADRRGSESRAAESLNRTRIWRLLLLPVPLWEGTSRHPGKCEFVYVSAILQTSLQRWACSTAVPHAGAPEHSRCGRKILTLESSLCFQDSNLQKRPSSGDDLC